MCAVSLVPTPATTCARSPTASTTARTSASFSASLVVGRLARGAVDDQAVVAGVHQMGGEPLRAVEVERAVARERRDHGGQDRARKGLRRGVSVPWAPRYS